MTESAFSSLIDPSGGAIARGAAGRLWVPFTVQGFRVPAAVATYTAQLWSGVASIPTLPGSSDDITCNVRVPGDVGSTVSCVYLNQGGYLREAQVVTAGPAGTEEQMFEFVGGVITATPARGTRINQGMVEKPFAGGRNVGAIDLSIDDGGGVPLPQVRIPAPAAVPNSQVSANKGYSGAAGIPADRQFLVCAMGSIAAEAVHLQRHRTRLPVAQFDGVWSLATGTSAGGPPVDPPSRIVVQFKVPLVFEPGEDARLIAETAGGDPANIVPGAWLAGYLAPAPNGAPDPNPERVPRLT